MASETPPPAVAVRDLHKWFRVYASPSERIKRVLGARSRHMDVQALDGVSFDLPTGTALGIIGENGSGKSTLMKIIAGTTAATAGEVEVRGIVAAILELGAAFHPEFTGRDNAVLYGALMGLDQREMKDRLKGIIDFAELGDFIDHPVKSYSTGMAMRLAFAVATHVDPDVLVVDEALAVGDGYFQKKCLDKIRDIKDKGTTIIFCSHVMYLVTSFCERAIWLCHGRVEGNGPAKEVAEAYEAYLQQRDVRRLEKKATRDEAAEPIQGQQIGRIVAVRLQGVEGELPRVLKTGDELVIDVEFVSIHRDELFHVAVSLDTLDGRCVIAASTERDGVGPLRGRTEHHLRFRIPSLPLAAGTFHVYAFLFDEKAVFTHDQVVINQAVRIETSKWTPSLIEVEHRWELD